MKDEEKAKEFANYFAGETDYKESAAYSSAMAEWKDEEYAKENKWINAEDKLPPFITTEDGSQYSKPVLCKEKCGSYCVARFVRWQTGHYMWLDSSDGQLNVKYWREIKD